MTADELEAIGCKKNPLESEKEIMMIWCDVCEDWIEEGKLKIWNGDDRTHYLCPGCGSDLKEIG